MTSVSPRGTYLRIAEDLRARLGGDVGQQCLPSEAALMREYGVSRSTVRRALHLLAAEGLIESSPGIGWRPRAATATPPLVEQMREELAAGGFEVGGTFHSEAALCGRFGFSRTAVRKALGQLEGEGLLEPVHGKGRIVKALPPASGTP
ncbi:GntR family transcriptional regulator [Streptomyces nondiastaticus]|uniref:GntR family transcriptional regulator n=1 Tax=Streptomyces nondiastaticus TaxID=3154512 RepID=A0ABW6U5D6_9ACTN